MSSTEDEVACAIQQDWKDRDFIEALKIHLRATTDFVSNLDVAVRCKINALDKKLSSLESKIVYVQSVRNRHAALVDTPTPRVP